jgi:hypothetical protein
MKKIEVFEADDGTLHRNEIDALKADTAYWKDRAQNPPKPERGIPQPGDPDHHYSYEGGHQ